MKKNIILIFLGIVSILKFDTVLASTKAICPVSVCLKLQSDTIVNQLTALSLAQYQGQPVDTLLARLPAGYITMKIGGWRSQRLAEVLYIIYPNEVSVGIHVRNFQFMDPHLVNTPNPKQNWDMTLFRKEAITYTIIFNGPVCINGCENKYK